jgi:hypothetical protein
MTSATGHHEEARRDPDLQSRNGENAANPHLGRHRGSHRHLQLNHLISFPEF